MWPVTGWDGCIKQVADMHPSQGELGGHQFETIEHTDDLRMGMRWYRTARGRLQLLQVHPPISRARTDSERCQHGVNPVGQRDTLPEELRWPESRRAKGRKKHSGAALPANSTIREDGLCT